MFPAGTPPSVYSPGSAVYNLIDPNVSRKRRPPSSSRHVEDERDQERSTIVFNAKAAYYAYNMAIANVRLREKLRDKYRVKLETTTILSKTGRGPFSM